MGLGDFLDDTSDIPERKIVALDPMTEKIVQEAQVGGASDYSDRAMKDIDQGNSAYERYNPGSGLMDAPFSQAIKQKYGNMLAEKTDKLKFNAKIKSRAEQMSRIERAQNLYMAKQQVQVGAFQRLMEAQQAREAARAQTINSILNTGMTIGGYALGGGFGALAANKTTGQQIEGVKPSNYRGENPNSSHYSNGYNIASSNYRESLRGIGEMG